MKADKKRFRSRHIAKPFISVLGRAVGGTLMILLISSCAGMQKDPQKPPIPAKAAQKACSLEQWRARAETSKGHSPTKAKRLAGRPQPDTGLRISTPAAEPPRRLPSQKLNMKMSRTPVPVLLRTMARAAGLNIMINESVTGHMDINVKDTTWDQVFLGILGAQGLSYKWEGDIIRIVSLKDRENELKQLEAEQKIRAKQRELQKSDPLQTRVVCVDYADAKDLRENLEKLITKQKEDQPLGSIMVHEGTNSLIIQAIPSDIDHIISLIDRLDQPTPQILIEAHIVEATRDTARELGIQWGGLSHSGNTWVYPGANSRGVLGNGLSAGGIDPTSGLAGNFPAMLEEGLGLTIGIAREALGDHILAVQLSALQEEGRLNILSSPSITTMDNQKALIEAGTEVPYQTVEDDEVKIEYKKAVLSLLVTPHVIEGSTLRLNINTSKNEVDFTHTVEGNPTIITRKAETNVILFDGQTTVIGGLNQETTSDAESGVPYLKDLPLLGRLFKGTDSSSKKEEVLIFITPHILKERTTEADAQ